MNPQQVFQRVCAWSGVSCMVLFFGALVLADFIPPLSPALSASEVAAHYREHATGIRFGSGLMLLSSMCYATLTAVICGQMRRIPGVHQTVVYTQLAAGAAGVVTFFLPAMLFAVTAFRPERAPEATLLLNDLSWIILVMPFPPFIAQNFAFSFAILTDRGRPPVFPRWLGYLNIWAPIMFVPALALPFFKSGPLSWSGIIVFWLAATVFVIQVVTNAVMVSKAVNTEEPEARHTIARDGAAITPPVTASV